MERAEEEKVGRKRGRKWSEREGGERDEEGLDRKRGGVDGEREEEGMEMEREKGLGERERGKEERKNER